MSKKVALVTGASRGIGRACAIELAKDGYAVAIHYRSGEEQAMKLAAELPDSKCFRADLSNDEDCSGLIKRVKDEMGRIDVLVNNAGISIDQVITFAKPLDFDELIKTNLRPVFLLSKLVSKIMIKQKGGSIVNMSSVVAHTGNAGQSMYAATKGGIESFSKSIALDLAGFGIRVNSVAPGFIDTEMTQTLNDEIRSAIVSKIPLRRLGTPRDIAKAVLFLCSDSASYVTGTCLHINGGMYLN